MIGSNIALFYKCCERIHSLPVVTLFLGSLCSQLLAQAPFPLSKGNAWHYTIRYPEDIPPATVSYTIRISGDSLMPNGKRFWIFDTPDMLGGRYIRSDSEYVFYWQHRPYDSTWSEQRVFNLQASFGKLDTIKWADFEIVRAFGPTPGTVLG